MVRHAPQHCVPCDGSAHAVIVEPVADAAPAIVEAPMAAVPQPVTEPLQPLEPIAPASAEKPLVPAPAAVPATPPAPEPQFKSAAEILAESAEQARLEQAAAEAARPAAAPAPQFKTAAEILAESPPQEPAALPMTQAAAAAPAPHDAPSDDECPADKPPAPVEPAPEPAPMKPARSAEENLFDDADELATDDEPAADKPAPMKKARAQEPVEDLFDEPEATEPAVENVPAAKESADEPPAEEKTEQAEDDPFAVLDTSPEPVRRWIDASGRHETIGRLVEVHPDRVRILKSNGRYTTVALERLSRHDQSYVTQVGERIAARRPAVTDTAQR